MTDPNPWYLEIALPALLRHARVTYGKSVRQALAAAGYDDMPRNGMYVIGGLGLGAGDVPLSQLIEELGVSKQAAGQLIDTLVERGYLARRTDGEDRRKLTITLTDRGKAAADVQRAAREKIDSALLERVGKENLTRTRKTLAALCGMGRKPAAH
jgi:DNA-binding MarR family transcriptional regulator